MQFVNKTALRAGVAAAFAAMLLAGCGGGGGSSGACVSGSAQGCGGTGSAGNGGGSGTSPSAPTALPPSDTLANICTLEEQKRFTRSYLDETYLWYREIPSVDASAFTSVPSYFYSLLTRQNDASGQPKDRFSFIASTSDADRLLTGAGLAYGVAWLQDAQGRTRAAYVEPGSPAAAAGISRGGELMSTSTPNADWYPSGPASISFVYRSTPASATTSVTLQAANIQEDPLPVTQTLVTGGGRKVAYLLFNAHTQGAQDKLIPALASAQAAGAQDVVLDMRYNGGGYLYTALSLSSMLSAPSADGKIFEQLRYNDKRQAETDASTLFFGGTVQYPEARYRQGDALPRLGLPRVYILATGNTCSASESVINSLRGIGVEVVLVGGTTCGKPYGFARRDNCGYAYFPIEFQGVNAQGFGDYAAGFTPTCAAADDFEHALGSTAERLLATALYHVDKGTCPAQPLAAPLGIPSSQPPGHPLLRGKLLPSR